MLGQVSCGQLAILSGECDLPVISSLSHEPQRISDMVALQATADRTPETVCLPASEVGSTRFFFQSEARCQQADLQMFVCRYPG